MSRIIIPDAVTSIGDNTHNNYEENVSVGAFANCTNLTEVTIGKGITRINKEAFYNCTNLKTARIDNGNVFIDDSAFTNCSIWLVIQAPCGSGVAKWAQNHGIDVERFNHTVDAMPSLAATCTEPGYTGGEKCSVCGEWITKPQTIAKKAHTAVTVKGKAATCTATGLTDGKKCSVCGEWITRQQTIAKKAHTPTTVKGKAATYTATGLTDGKKCSVCGEWITKQQTIARKVYPGSTLKKKGKNGTITATIGTPFCLTPQFATDAKVTVKGWTSSKKKVATVSKSGLVTPKKAGKTTITVTTGKKKVKATVTIRVIDPTKPTGISLKQGSTITLKVGQKLKLTPILAPAGAKSNLEWSTSRKRVAKVSKSGVVTARRKGTATITVTTTKNKKATTKIKIRVK